MSGRILVSLLLLVSFGVGQSKPVVPSKRKPETPHIDFVKEYVRELMADENLRAAGEKEFKEATTPNEQFSTSIYFSKSVQLELRLQIAMLKGMRLYNPFEELIPNFIALYQRQSELHQALIDISSKFLTAPRKGVDYQALGAKVPEIRAQLDSLGKALFEASPAVFMSLIDLRADSRGHANHLVITKDERMELQNLLDILLKDKPDKGDQNNYIGAAMVLRAGLQKEYKCSDEPWD